MIRQEAVETMRECSQRSFENMPFPEVVAKLASVGVETYHADLYRHERTYYLPNGESHVEREEERFASQLAKVAVPPELDAAAVQEAVGQIQKRQIGYLEFLECILRAGVCSYNVYLRGRRTIYTGRTGDEHVEWFPQGK